MRKSTFNILFYGKRSAIKANGKMPIMGRITVNGQAVQFGAKVEVVHTVRGDKSFLSNFTCCGSGCLWIWGRMILTGCGCFLYGVECFLQGVNDFLQGVDMFLQGAGDFLQGVRCF